LVGTGAAQLLKMPGQSCLILYVGFGFKSENDHL
jgi:hypothetical protein